MEIKDPETKYFETDPTKFDLNPSDTPTGVKSDTGSGIQLKYPLDTYTVKILKDLVNNTTTSSAVTSIIAGSGIGVSSAVGDITISNTGIISLTASTGISVAGSTIANTGVLRLTASTGVTVTATTGNISISVAAGSTATYKSGFGNIAYNATSTTQTIAHGLGMTPKIVRIHANYDQRTTNINIARSYGTYNGTTMNMEFDTYIQSGGGLNGAAAGSIVYLPFYDTSYDQTATITFDSTNLYLSWVKTGSPTSGLIYYHWEAES